MLVIFTFDLLTLFSVFRLLDLLLLCKTLFIDCTSASEVKRTTNLTEFDLFKLNILDYCDVVWASCNEADIERLESLQRRASKIIVKSKCSTTSIDYLKFQSLEDCRNTHILGLVKRCLNNKVPQFLKYYFKLNKEVISRETRRNRGYYMAARGYEFYLRVLKVSLTSERSSTSILCSKKVKILIKKRKIL